MVDQDLRRSYTWWWDSHIPKNSKWLQDNLTEMDTKVESMTKLIEGDADSFSKRAEIYSEKRPQLMMLLEEFHGVYRALAEKYDHSTRELRQAHRTMAELNTEHSCKAEELNHASDDAGELDEQASKGGVGIEALAKLKTERGSGLVQYNNLTDMDNKVETMIMLVEGDASSFAKRATMYYEKRPHLMMLLEEFYRAYRALAARYDHIIGELHKANRAAAELAEEVCSHDLMIVNDKPKEEVAAPVANNPSSELQAENESSVQKLEISSSKRNHKRSLFDRVRRITNSKRV